MSYNAGSAFLSVRPDFSSFQDDLKAEMASQGAEAGQAFSDAFKAELEGSLADLHATVTPGADTTVLDAELDDATRDRTAKIGIDDTELASQVAAADADLDDATRDRTAKIGLDDGDLTAKAAEDDAKLDEAAKNRTAKIDVDDTGLGNVSPLILAIGAAIVTLGPAALGATVGLGLLGAAFGAAALTGGGLTSVAHDLETAVANGAESVSGFGQALQSVGTTSLQDFESAANSAGQGLGTLFVDFAPEIEKVAGLVDDLATDFDNWAKSVNASGLDNFLAKVFDPQTISELKTDLGDIATILENVGKAVEMISPVALEALTDVLNGLAKIPPGVIAGLTLLFVAMKAASVLSGPVGSVIDAISAYKQARSAGDEIGGELASGIEDGAKEAEAGVDEIIGGLGEGAAGEANAAGAAAGGAFAAGVGEGAGGVGAEISGAIGGIGLLALAGAFTAGALLGAAVGAGFTSGLGVTGAAGKLEAAVKSAASGAGSWLEEAGEQAAKGFADGFESGISASSSEASKIKDALTSALSGVDSALESEGQQAARDFMDGLEKGFGEGLADIGKNVVEGLIEGIESQASDLEHVAEDIAHGVVSAIEGVLGISSPSTVTRQDGAWTGEGFGLGLEDSRPFVEHAASQLGAVSAAALSGMGTSQSLGALSAIGAASSLPGVSGPLGTGAMQLQVSWAGGGDELTNAVVKSLRFSVQQNTGGDVQAHLGRGRVRT